MTVSSFNPQAVPAGIVQDMAKRLSKCSEMKDVPLSKCQEIMARTFGHANFHELKNRAPFSRAKEGLMDPAVRVLFYTLLGRTDQGGVATFSGLDWIAGVAAQGGQWPLHDLASASKAMMLDGLSLGSSLEKLMDGQLTDELFLLTTIGPSADILSECARLAGKACDALDRNKLMGGLA